MNLIDAVVTLVIGLPEYDKEFDKWLRKVKYESWGQPGTTTLIFSTEEAALKCKPGFKFLT